MNSLLCCASAHKYFVEFSCCRCASVPLPLIRPAQTPRILKSSIIIKPSYGFGTDTAIRKNVSYNFKSHGSTKSAVAATSNPGSAVEIQDFGEPISLGTMKLPPNVDLKKMENLLFQWGNSLTQNASLPLQVPLKVDKVQGGVRLGFVRVNDGEVEDLVHIDCLIFPADGDSVPIFRALRNGKLKNETPPGEPIIMQRLLEALKKSIAIAMM